MRARGGGRRNRISYIALSQICLTDLEIIVNDHISHWFKQLHELGGINAYFE